MSLSACVVRRFRAGFERYVTCLVEAGTPVEIKGCIPEQQNGSGTTPGRWYIKRESHDQLAAAGGVYYLTVYAPQPLTPVIAALIVSAATVGDLLAGSWYQNGRREVAKLRWSRVIDETAVQQ